MFIHRHRTVPEERGLGLKLVMPFEAVLVCAEAEILQSRRAREQKGGN